MSRISESELVLPALFLLSMQSDGFLSTTKLIRELEKLLHPSVEDLYPNSSRNDSRFSQIVRNLKSHNTFERYGYAENVYGGFRITTKGRKFVAAKQEVLRYIFGASCFNFSDILTECDDLLTSNVNQKVIPLTEFVREGGSRRIERLVRERSARLRDVAREYFQDSKDGLLYCKCCNFEFSHHYYPNFSDSCIEIHHIKPIHSYEGDDFDKTIADALKNMLPVCPNCHRVIHKNKIGAEQIKSFISNCHPFSY